ncbi:DMT family transporter [Paenibacillus sp. D2_2]|uniref:DMT family transporter n=1 Tax=Paenibacillus sp. D2_2 TaxID=3073092 RepID=UPI002816515B|nr:DMT family transporter [Paenibacillus sp. D2_2]WMT39523.1 DMT family transporter [Paenibacillus sp. D2_2]
MSSLSRSRAALYLIFLVVVWGVNWPLSKVALEYAPPVLFAGLRTLIGGVLLIVVALPSYKKLNLRRNWPMYLFSSLLNIVLYYGLQTIGLQYLPAGLFSAIVFLQPVLLGIFSWLWLGESMYGLKMVGLFLGFLGVFEISAGGLAGHLSITGILLALGSALSWAFGTVYMKKATERVDMFWMLASQLTIGGLLLLGTGSYLERWNDITWNVAFISDLLFISVFVIALGWLVYFSLIGSGEAGKVGAFTFLIPVISIVCSVIFLGESVTWNLVAGLGMIVISILLVNFKPAALRRASE